MGPAFWAVVVGIGVGLLPRAGVGQQERPTVQKRFAAKKNHVYGHVTTMTHVRNDFYKAFGLGVDAGYYPWEKTGFEARYSWVSSTLSKTARDVKSKTGLTPDARPQEMMATVGVRYSLGYGKFLVGKDFLVHFDPQLAIHSGIAVAEKRVIPTTTLGLSLLTHYKWGIQVKFDISAAIQVEKRRRGWIPSIGFAPYIGFGGTIGFGEIGEALGLDGEGDS